MYELGDEREGVEMKSETKTALRWFGLSEGEESDEGWVRLAEVEGVPESRTMVIRHTQIGSCGCSRCPSRLVLAADHLQHSNHTVCLASYAIRQLHSYRYNVGTRRGIGQSRLMSACTRTTLRTVIGAIEWWSYACSTLTHSPTTWSLGYRRVPRSHEQGSELRCNARPQLQCFVGAIANPSIWVDSLFWVTFNPGEPNYGHT